MTAMEAVIFNPGKVAVVYDAAGHTIGGGEWLTVNTAEHMTAELIRTGKLIRVEGER